MYIVGQILYTIIEKKRVIFPIKVVEEITIKNLEEEKISYKVVIPNSKKEKVDLDKFEKIFTSLDNASNFMLEKAREAIDEIKCKAHSLEESYFKEDEKEIFNDACKNEIENIKIDLGDGIKANINMSDIEKINPEKEIKESIIEENSNTWWL